MVGRQLDNIIQGATVVDLDGTYVRVNTLKAYISIGIGHLLRRGRLFSAIAVAAIVVARRLRLIRHTTMKFKALNIIGSDPSLLNAFGAKMRRYVNDDVRRLLEWRQKSGDRILLASAATAFYIPVIWDGDFVATDFDGNYSHIECRGIEKLRRVSEWLEANNLKLNYVITDHHDDAPLLQANNEGTNVLVNPSAKTLRFFREFEPTHFLLIKEITDNGITR